MSKLEVGQKLWLVTNGWRGGFRSALPGEEVTVTKVGRKWAELDHGRKTRIDINTLRVDSQGFGHSPGRCYLSREVYEIEVRDSETWRVFHNWTRDKYGKPDGLTADAIREAAKLLGFEIP